MHKLANFLVGLIALEHIYILVLEMFLWTTPRGLAAFGMTQEQADATAVLAGNQGLYNGFLAAGLIWGLFARSALTRSIKMFFLGCILVAGVYGGVTAKTSILFVQAAPAAVALLLVGLAKRS
jgi:putative membrane protein